MLMHKATTAEQLDVFLNTHKKLHLAKTYLDQHHTTAVHLCAQTGNFRLISVLVKHGGRGDTKDNYQSTAYGYLLTWVPLWCYSNLFFRKSEEQRLQFFTSMIEAALCLIKSGAAPNATHMDMTILILVAQADIEAPEKLRLLTTFIQLGVDPSIGYSPLRIINNKMSRDRRDFSTPIITALLDCAVLLIKHGDEKDIDDTSCQTVLEKTLFVRASIRARYVPVLLALGCKQPVHLFDNVWSHDCLFRPEMLMNCDDIKTTLALCAVFDFNPPTLRQLLRSLFIMYPAISEYLLRCEDLTPPQLTSPAFISKINRTDLRLQLRQYDLATNPINFLITLLMFILNDKKNPRSTSLLKFKLNFDILMSVLAFVDPALNSLSARHIAAAVIENYAAIKKESQKPGGIGILGKVNPQGHYQLGFFKSAQTLALQYKYAEPKQKARLKSKYALTCWKSELKTKKTLTDQLALQESVSKSECYQDMKLSI